jgi:hypothetical protein
MLVRQGLLCMQACATASCGCLRGVILLLLSGGVVCGMCTGYCQPGVCLIHAGDGAGSANVLVQAHERLHRGPSSERQHAAFGGDLPPLPGLKFAVVGSVRGMRQARMNFPAGPDQRRMRHTTNACWLVTYVRGCGIGYNS